MQPKSLILFTFLLGVAVAAPVADSPSKTIIPVPSDSFSGVPPTFSGTPSSSHSFPAPSGLPTQLTVHPSGGPRAPTESFPVSSGSLSLPPPFSGTPPRPSGSFTGPHPSWTVVPPI
ncbi:hypothetical protein ACGC1H_002265 [Rhizoctonia solani]|uniref:Uncharacterized protein n=1 Tax=Rhizoctonia solani TaxID=456999 RepID=A0A8H3A8W1_9AGAM|nr:unnamed protein product [Rhizoctonia solani]